MADFRKALVHTLRWEGGYQDHPADPGNYNSIGELVGTNHGIAAPTLEAWLGTHPSKRIMQNLTIEAAGCIYRSGYWESIKGDSIINQEVANILFDGHVNHGRTGIRLMQDVLHVKRDGIVGPNTLNAINTAPPHHIYPAYKEARRAFYLRIVQRRPEMEVFLKGWLNRINSFKYYL